MLDSSLKSLEITWYLSSRIFTVSLHLGASIRLDRPPFLHPSPLETSIHWLAFFGFKFSLLHLVHQNIDGHLPRAQIYEICIWGCREWIDIKGKINQILLSHMSENVILLTLSWKLFSLIQVLFLRDFPGTPVVKTLSPSARGGGGFDLLLGS